MRGAGDVAQCVSSAYPLPGASCTPIEFQNFSHLLRLGASTCQPGARSCTDAKAGPPFGDRPGMRATRRWPDAGTSIWSQDRPLRGTLIRPPHEDAVWPA
jgi:hypothetical protein